MAGVRPSINLPWPIDYEDGVCAIAHDEGCRLKAYKCQAGKWTCGYGETDDIGPSTAWTQDFADRRFCNALTYRTQTVRAACTVEPTAHQLAALVSFAYNYGGWRTSTVLKCHNKRDFIGAARAFDLVNQYTDPKTGKRVVSAGLTARRKREAALYLKPPDNEPMNMPQIVDPEKSLAKSPTVITGGTAAAVGTASLFANLGEQVGSFGTVVRNTKVVIVEHLGIAPSVLPWILLVVFGGVVIWRRYKNRIQGWM